MDDLVGILKNNLAALKALSERGDTQEEVIKLNAENIKDLTEVARLHTETLKTIKILMEEFIKEDAKK